ncbi:MAG TPA: c-type cytochrome biogenesis protein CcmI [Caulobacteraceae bacterium]|jgi:cytochrome c-type biogenesis protein CcmH
MIWLWIAAALMSAGLAALVVQRAVHAAAAAGGENPALAVYRRQMAELDDLAERGLIGEGERRSVRAETGRRLLAVAGRAEPVLSASKPGVIFAAAAAAPLLALAAYLALGAPGFPDQPFATRLADWRSMAVAEPQGLSAPEWAAVWNSVVRDHPNDAEPLSQLATYQLAAGQPLEAAAAIQKALTLAPRRADLWVLLGEADATASNGDIGPDAVAAFQKALALDPTSAPARYALGRARIARGDVAGGLADWRALEASLKPDDPSQQLLARQIADVAAHGQLPAQAAPESGAQAAAGSGGSVGPAQIQSMVDGLAARLKASPDDPDGWVRLVRAYGVLGETDRQSAALAEARRQFAGRPDVLAALSAASHPPAAAASGQ